MKGKVYLVATEYSDDSAHEALQNPGFCSGLANLMNKVHGSCLGAIHVLQDVVALQQHSSPRMIIA